MSHSYPLPGDTLELRVHSAAFDEECTAYSHQNHRKSPSNHSDADSDHSNLWEMDSSSSSISSVESYDVSKVEAYLYYFGIRGHRRWGPKLIFRTSKDVFRAPSGPEQIPRLMRLLPVYEHQKLGKENLWATILAKVVELLDQRNIQHSSIDLVRFCWVEDDEDVHDDGDIDDADLKIAPYRKVVTTPTTIWVGVLADTLTGEKAFHSSKDILNALKEHGIVDVDVAYRESVARGFSGPELFAPVSDSNPLKAIIDPVTTALGLPIAGLKTLRSQGTMGFYFRVGQDLYAVTARHVLFPNPENEGNNPYSYIAGPKKEVVLMGTQAFSDFIASIKGHIGTLLAVVEFLEMRATAYMARTEGSHFQAAQVVEAQRELEKARTAIEETRTAIAELKMFYVKTDKWMQPRNRVIGHVVWAPPISVSTTPHGHTKDVCVIKLDKTMFLQNFRGNVLDLGPDIDVGKFMNLMHPRMDDTSDFVYPFDRLLKLRGILSAEDIRKPISKDLNGDPVRYVIKHGLTTLTTVGRLNGFESHVRRYFEVGSRDSLEAAVYSYDINSGPFSSGGDSGSIIVDAVGKFVALLTGGTGPTDSSDITYGSPMYWLWEIIEGQFPDARLDFEDDFANA